MFCASLGSGNYGKVALVKNLKNNFFYAIKIISRKQIDCEQLHSNLELERNILDLLMLARALEKEIVIEMQDIKEEKEVKKKSEKGVLDESTAKNRLIGSEEEINDEPEFDENAVGIQDNVFVKDPSQLQKVNWWRRMKMIFIVICIILAIGLYVSIPFLMKYRDKFSVLTNNSTKTVRLLRINSNDTE